MTTKANSPAKPCSLSNAAARLGCSLPTVYELIGAGTLRSYHIGRAHRVSEEAITDCIRALEAQSAARRGAGKTGQRDNP